MNEYDVNETVRLYATFLAGATVGSMIAGQFLLVVRDTDELVLTASAPIVVEGAGFEGGDLVTTVSSATGNRIILAAAAEQDATHVVVGNPATPSSVTCTVRHPDGTNENCATTQAGARWKARVTVEQEGDHYYRFDATGADTGSGWKKFVVRPERVPIP